MIDRKCITSKVLCDVNSGGGCFQVADLSSIFACFLSVVLIAAGAGNASKSVFFYAVFINKYEKNGRYTPKGGRAKCPPFPF